MKSPNIIGFYKAYYASSEKADLIKLLITRSDTTYLS
jgi:hypothetical protein